MKSKDRGGVLGDHVELQRGTTYKSALLDQSGPVLLGLSSITRNGGFRSDSLRTYGGDTPAKLLVRPGQLYVSLKDVTQSGDLLGSIARVPDSVHLGRLTQDTVRLDIMDEGLPADYLYWLLRTPQYRAHCRAHATGTTNLGLSRKDFLAFEIPPMTAERRALVSTVQTLDEKIENNRRIASTIEKIAAALFKARFVDFVDHDDRVGSEIGLIPRGWEVGSLREMATVTMGQSPPSTTYSEDSSAGPVMVQGKGAFGVRYPEAETFCSAPTRVALPGDLLMTVRAPVGELNICTQRTCLGRGVAGIASIWPAFIEFSLRYGAERWRAYEGGTIYPSVNKRQVEEFPLLIPPDEVVHEFEAVTNPIRSMIESCHRGCSTFASLRDALLPLLVSGEIRVPAASSEGSPA